MIYAKSFPTTSISDYRASNIMSNNQSDASQCIQDGVANMSPDVKKRIAETMKKKISKNHTLKDDGLGCAGIVHSSENVSKPSNKAAFVLDEILAKIQALEVAKLNPIAVCITEQLFNDICGDKLVLMNGTIMPKKSAMKKIYGLPIKIKEPTILPDEKQFSIEVV